MRRRRAEPNRQRIPRTRRQSRWATASPSLPTVLPTKHSCRVPRGTVHAEARRKAHSRVFGRTNVRRAKAWVWLVDLTAVSSNLFLDWVREADALRRAAA